jgi:hypothetical protein
MAKIEYFAHYPGMTRAELLLICEALRAYRSRESYSARAIDSLLARIESD